MKTRNGYVSNSSSSSFVVIIKDDCHHTQVTKEQVNLLLGYGFKYIKEFWRHALIEGAELFDNTDGFSVNDNVVLYYDVPCNEQDVEDFLFENRIPFVESEEYNTRIVVYDGVNDWYDTYLNSGVHFMIYGMSSPEMDRLDLERLVQSRPFYRTRLSDGKDITDEIFDKTELRE